MYAEVGRFKPGDRLIGKVNPVNFRWPAKDIVIIATKKRTKKKYHMYKLQCRSPEGQLHTISKYVTYIDSQFELSLKHKLKNL